MAGQDDRVGDVPYRRLRAIAANRLGLRGLDVADPAAQAELERLLGPLGYATLVAEPKRNPTVRTFSDCLTLLENLDDPDRVAWVPSSGRTRLPLLLRRSSTS